MSQPPPGAPPPPAGYYYSPPPRSSSSGCWKAFGITCGVLVLLAGVLVFMAGRAIREGLAHPKPGSIFSIGRDVAQATRNGILIQRAIVAYHQQYGKYPDSLVQLVQKGLVDARILHSPIDADSSDPAHISYKYTKPAAGAPGDTPLLDMHYRLNINFGSTHQAQDGDIVINLDGQRNRALSQQRPSGPSASGTGVGGTPRDGQ